MSHSLQNYIQDVHDFPRPGIVFKDLTPLLANPDALQRTYEKLANEVKDLSFDLIIGPESRGFIFGVGLSIFLKKGFIPIRKKGKLPGKTYRTTYSLEYGQDTLELKQDAITKGQSVLIVDDLLATGGTMKASLDLVQQAEGKPVGCAFVVELDFLQGRKQLTPHPVFSLIHYS